MGFEIFVLAIVNELYFRRFDQAGALAEGRRRLPAKIEQLEAFASEPPAATRSSSSTSACAGASRASGSAKSSRRFKREVPEYFKGTSNVHLARKQNLVPIGTMAHEYLQAYQALGVRLRDFQKAALEDWVQEYRGDLGSR